MYFSNNIFSLKKECHKYLTFVLQLQVSSQIMTVIHDHGQGLFLTQSMHTK